MTRSRTTRLGRLHIEAANLAGPPFGLGEFYTDEGMRLHAAVHDRVIVVLLADELGGEPLLGGNLVHAREIVPASVAGDTSYRQLLAWAGDDEDPVCGPCLGSGRLHTPCQGCGGRGKTLCRCAACGHGHSKPCGDCNRTGREPCGDCGGTGKARLMEREVIPRAETGVVAGRKLDKRKLARALRAMDDCKRVGVRAVREGTLDVIGDVWAFRLAACSDECAAGGGEFVAAEGAAGRDRDRTY